MNPRRSEQRKRPQKPRILVIGCGSIGKRHISNLIVLRAGEIRACDGVRERAQETGTRFGIETGTSLAAAWKWMPDVVLIATPPSSHVELAIEAARRGCDLFIEKPLSDRTRGIRELSGLVRKKDLVSMVGCNLRFHPGLVHVKQLLENRRIGRVVSAAVEFGQYLPDWHPAEDYRSGYSARVDLGGGVILDAIHEIDYIRWLIGEVKAVACMAGIFSSLELRTEDTAAMLLYFTRGAVGEVHLDYVQRAYSRRCKLVGEEGTIAWDFTAGTVRWFAADDGCWRTFRTPRTWDVNRMYIDEMRHFLASRASRVRTCLDVDEAARVLEIAFAAKRSAKSSAFVRMEGR